MLRNARRLRYFEGAKALIETSASDFARYRGLFVSRHWLRPWNS